jgi:hypothetical protein
MISQEIDEGDIQALDALHSANAGERKTLADLIFSKLESGTGVVMHTSKQCTSHLCLLHVSASARTAGCSASLSPSSDALLISHCSPWT